MVDQTQTCTSGTEERLSVQLQRHFPQLSGRHLEVVRFLVAGQSEKQIARSLRISRHTVHVHMKEIYTRIHVRSRGELLGGIIHRILQEKS